MQNEIELCKRKSPKIALSDLKIIVSALSPNFIFYCIAIQSITCFIPSQSIGFTLRLTPRFSPESPFYPGNLTFEEKVEKAMELSMSRAHRVDYLSTEGSMSTNNIRLMVHPDNYYYTTQVDLGTPRSTQTLLVDTGSTLLWTQCAPCVNCYNQSIPIFAPDQSSSYSKIPCNDQCRGYKCINGQCRYRVTYAGGAASEGFMSRETFTFESNKGPKAVPNIVFGCGNDNQGFTFDQHMISGILGLNFGANSLIVQLFRQIEGRFSLCLVYSPGEVTAKSPLRFGEDAVLPGRQEIQTLKIVKGIGTRNYYVNLIDVSVGDKRIGFPPGTFELQRSGEGGCLIDTGSTATFFGEGPYNVVMKEFDDHFKSFHRERVYNVSKSLNYCYKYDPRFRAYASMTLHFPNANYVVTPTYQYFHYDRLGHFCVAVLQFPPGRGQKTVIGAWQMQDMRFLFDLKNGLIRFAPENCAADH